ncbi:MAG: hypothetical protein R2725_12310 [Solirubrobacterales bacterium]
MDAGAIDQAAFCATANASLEEAANTTGEDEGEAEFSAGWEKTAPPDSQDLGAAIYNALWAGYCL